VICSVTVVEWLLPPPAPVIVSVLVPDLALRPVPIVSVDPLKDAVAPAGTPLTLSATVAVKPPDGVIVTV
jgi:hypothetical protein